jgi:2-hydroxychromene-2-carboxylate isomerase
VARLRYFFDVVCPFAYLASTRVEALAAEAGAELVWEPVLLGGLLKGLGGATDPMETMPPPKAKLTVLDYHRQASLLGVPLRKPPEHPRRTVDAMRLLAAAPDAIVPPLAHALFRAYWVENRDVTDRAVLRAIAATHGLDADAIWGDPVRKERLRERTDAALREGVFGVPTFVVGDELVWGVDRLPRVRARLGLARGPEGGVAPPSAARPGGRIEWFHDFASPFSYLSTRAVRELADRAGATLVDSPILLGALFKDIGGPNVPLFAMSQPRQRWQMRDMISWAEERGMPFRFPSVFPLRTVTALRVALVEPAVTDAVYRAAWVDDRDIGQDDVLAGVLSEAGFDARALLDATRDPAIKDRLRANTDHAREIGACGVPSFLVNGAELFWGQDRLPQVAHALAGWHTPVT